jgi:FtsP/CotA-like multicopper oxidase with cupredoxin domain
MTEVPSHRPRFRAPLRTALAAALVLTATACAGGSRPVSPAVQRPIPPEIARLPALAPNYADSLREPLTVRPVNGVLNATLDVTLVDLPVTRAGNVSGGTIVTDTVFTDTLALRAYTLAATTDPAYQPNDPRFTPRFPGPTFRVRPGDLVQIWLRNKLPPPVDPSDSNDVCMTYPAADSASPADVYQDCFHGPNFTNIHYHGMHVTPDSTSTAVGDDVLMVIAPGDSILYSFRVPMNQSPGTHWYHPHKHGSVALQVANGMAGAFIVEDPTTGLDRFVQQFNVREHLIGFQQVDTTVGLFHGDQTNILDKVPPLVNGQNFPTLYMAPGEVQRWRIVNENVTRNTKTLEFRFQDLPGEEPVVVEVARDGVQFSLVNMAVDNDSVLLMAAGNRLDVIVQAPLTPGTHLFRVRQTPGASRLSRRAVLPLQTRLGENDPQLSDQNAYLLFRVVVDPNWKGTSTGLPRSEPRLSRFLGGIIPGIPAFLGTNLPPSSDPAVIVFSDVASPGNYRAPTQFYLGSYQDPMQRFNDTVVFVPADVAGNAMPMVLDSTQSWRVVNNSVNGINHPFHIHINPFQVDSVHAPAGTSDPFYAFYQELNAASRRGSPIWLDVVPLPSPAVNDSGSVILDDAGMPVDPGYVFITQRYEDFEGCTDGKCGPATGQFVMHCHILGHEERGMMQVLEVVGHPSQPVSRVRGHGAHGAHPAGHGAAAGSAPAQGAHRH